MAYSNALIAFLADRSAFCYAAQDILKNVGGLPIARLPGDKTELPDEVLAVDFKRARADGPRGKRPGLGDGSRQEYSIFFGTLEVKYGLLRAKNTASAIVGCMNLSDEKEAIIRACFLRSQQNFTVGRLVNFAIDDIVEETPPIYAVDNTNNRERDMVQCSFLISYERIMANFPSA